MDSFFLRKTLFENTLLNLKETLKFENLSKLISTSNYMFGKSIWDKLPECIFEKFEIGRVKRGQLRIFKNHDRVIYSQNCPNQTYVIIG